MICESAKVFDVQQFREIQEIIKKKIESNHMLYSELILLSKSETGMSNGGLLSILYVSHFYLISSTTQRKTEERLTSNSSGSINFESINKWPIAVYVYVFRFARRWCAPYEYEPQEANIQMLHDSSATQFLWERLPVDEP